MGGREGEESERGGDTDRTPCNYLLENDVWAIRVRGFTLRTHLERRGKPPYLRG